MSTPDRLPTDAIDKNGAKLFVDTIERLFPLLDYIAPFEDAAPPQGYDTDSTDGYSEADLHGWGGAFAVNGLSVVVDILQGAAGSHDSSYRVQVIHPSEKIGKHAMRIIQEYEHLKMPWGSDYSEYPEVWDVRRKAWRRPEFIQSTSEETSPQEEPLSLQGEAQKLLEEEGFERVAEFWAHHHEIAKRVGLDNTFTYGRLNTVIALLDSCKAGNKTDEA